MRFVNVLLISVALVFVFGCGMMDEKQDDVVATDPTPAATESTKPEVGDTVVARWQKNSFYQGEVESIDGTRISVKWEDGSSPTKVDASDVYALPKEGAKPDVKEGDIVLAKTGGSTYWNGAEITKIDGDVYGVKTVESGATSNVSGAKIIKVSADVAANLKEKAGSTDFLAEAREKSPKGSSDYEPKEGDKVIGEWASGSWWTGKVEKIDGNKTTVAWDDGSTPSAIATSKVFAHPDSADTNMPEEKQFLLIKPASGSKWEYAQTVSVKDKEVEAKTSGGATRTVKSGEFMMLE